MKYLSPAFLDAFAILLLVLLLLPMKPDVASHDDAPTGSIVVEIHWPDRFSTDVDLWVQSPGDKPVGYSRLRGNAFSLFRDDLGNRPEVQWRYEIAASRSIPDGAYAVNIHAYSDNGLHLPFMVAVSVWYRSPEGLRSDIWSGEVQLSRRGEEITAVRWKMHNGNPVYGSIHHTPILLRSGGYAP